MPILDRLPPDHAVHGTLARAFKPLLSKPNDWDQDGQQNGSANDIEEHLANR